MIMEPPPSLAASESRFEGDSLENREAITLEDCALEQHLVAEAPPSAVENGSQRRKAPRLERTKMNAKNSVTCRVLLLDNSEHVVELNKKVKGQALFDVICKHVNVIEKDYFSCSYRDRDDSKIWLNMDKKLCKQVDGDGLLQFEFEVKFYPSDFDYLQEDITRYQLCLQVQRDIASGRLPCSFVTYALLGSYLIQSELGNYSSDEMGLGASYAKHFRFAPNQSDELVEKVVELHRTHRGLSPAESDMLYLLNASKLALYGMELHEAKDCEGNMVTLGISCSGLVVYQERLRISRFIWPRILRISYKGRYFHVLVRPSELDDGDSNISFKFPTHRVAKRVWQTVVEFHSFYRLKEPEPVHNRFFFPRFGSSKFQYSGRTQHQSREVSSQIDRPAPIFDRSLSRRLNSSDPTGIQSMSKNVAVVVETVNNKQKVVLRDEDFECRPLEVNGNNREGSPTVSCSSYLTSNCSHQLTTTPSRCSSRSEGRVVKQHTRTITCAAPGSDFEDFGMLVSAHSHSSRSRTVETTTYQMERDGVVETRVEKKVLLSADGHEIDHSMILADVIRSVADVNPNLSVEKIEIQTRSEVESN